MGRRAHTPEEQMEPRKAFLSMGETGGKVLMEEWKEHRELWSCFLLGQCLVLEKGKLRAWQGGVSLRNSGPRILGTGKE